MDTIRALDHYLFQLFNSGLTCGFLDWFMPIITNAKLWVPFVILAWLGLIIFGSKKHRILALLLVVGAGATDLICARIIKNTVKRIRPCAVRTTNNFKCRLLLGKKNSKSFPSNHAANNAAFATVIYLQCGWLIGLPFIFIAFLIGYSRVYVGVHYPIDVIAGWFFGFLISYICVKIMIKLFPKHLTESNTINNTNLENQSEKIIEK